MEQIGWPAHDVDDCCTVINVYGIVNNGDDTLADSLFFVEWFGFSRGVLVCGRHFVCDLCKPS